MHAHPHKAGLAFGATLAGFHIVWGALVLTGFGQMLYDFVLWAHMIHIPVTIGPFDITASATLIVITAVFGYAMGYAGAWVWNKVHKV